MDSRIFGQVQKLNEYKAAPTVYLYASSAQEADTRKLIEDAIDTGKRVACPKVTGEGTMDFYEIASLGDLIPGYRGILEPSNDCPLADFFPPVIFVPGVAFDRNFMRIGYGKGFYDRYFDAHADVLRGTRLIALAYGLQLRDEIPSEDHDRRMDIIITEEEIWTREKDS